MKAYVRLLLVLGLAMFLSAGIYFGLDADWSKIEDVELTLAQDSSQKFVNGQLLKSLQNQLSSWQGRRIWAAPLHELMATVENDPRVRSARVSRIFPNRLKVEITPQYPILAWINEVGQFLPVAMDASLLPALGFSETIDVPLLRGKVFAEKKLREKAIRIITSLPLLGPLQPKNVGELTYDYKNGFSLLMNQGGVVIKIGEEEVGLKASRIEKVLNYLRDQQLRGRVIDARFAKKVVVRLRNGL